MFGFPGCEFTCPACAQLFIHQYFQIILENLLGKCRTWEDLKSQGVNRIFFQRTVCISEGTGCYFRADCSGLQSGLFEVVTILKVRSNSGESGHGVGIWCSGESREMREAE